MVLSKSDYDSKMMDLLGDEKTYRKLKKDPTPNQERKMNAKLLALKKDGSLPEPVYCRLHSSGGSVPLMYGLPKIHQPGVPLRPIVSFVSSPTYQLSKYLSRVLSPLIGHTESYVSNSAEFVSFTKSIRVPSDYVLVSYDVVSLFTNVPTDLAVSIVKKRLDEMDVSHLTELSPDQIADLLQFCLSSTFLCYDGQFYEQVFGTAMGSPVSVVVANIVMEDIESRALQSAPVQPLFWKRYVDDILSAVPILMRDTGTMLGHINSIDDNIQFTCEEERDGCISFLDVSISRDQSGLLSTGVYRKPINSHRPIPRF